MGLGSIFLTISPFWWLMTTRPEQANNKKKFKFKNYQLARMQCKGQGYMMLEYPTQIPIEDHLALANVPMWHCEFKPCFLQILPLLRLIHNPLSSLSRTITTCRHQLDAFLWSFKFSPFGIKHRKERHQQHKGGSNFMILCMWIGTCHKI